MIDYVELHCHSYFSLCDGVSSPEELVSRATELGMNTLALTDHDAVYGAVRFVKAAREQGVHPILGAELTLDDSSHLTLLVKDEEGWENLCTILSHARHNAAKGEAQLPTHTLEHHTQGLIALSGCRQGRIASALQRRDRNAALLAVQEFVQWFGHDNFWIELQNHRLPEDRWLIEQCVQLAQFMNVGYAVTNNAHYARQEQHRLQDVLVCIRHNETLDENQHLRPNSEFHLKSGQELFALFNAYPQALNNTRLIADQCHFELSNGLQELPTFPTPTGMSAEGYLHQLCLDKLHHLQLGSAAETQLEYELNVIRASKLSNYFLVVWDIVRFARENSILCQGRGSAANSLVAYLLGISPINPLAHDLVFERFLSAERQVVPDIDIDFDAARREEVIQYIYRQYGLDHAAMACTLVTFRARSAIRDVGKALGLPLEVLEHVTATLDKQRAQHLKESASLQDVLGNRVDTQMWKQILELSEQIDGLPRHIGIHNGGMVITATPIQHRVPTEPATMEDRYVVQWDKDSLEDNGLIKIDILGLRMLSAIAEAIQWVQLQTGAALELERLSFDDPAVYDMICAADTIGVFQVESRAQAQVLPRLQPRTFADLIVSISLIRPGPVQGDMVHPYLRRRLGTEPVHYFHPLLKPALKETLGVILFQEQVLKVARDLAGFSAGQGELLRRALGGKNPIAEITRLQEAFIQGAVTKGVDEETAALVFEKLRAFGGYSFPKSHAAAFAVLVYRSAWLKQYHPQAFYTGLLNNQPMGFWSPAVIVHDAKRHHVPIYKVDIQRSKFLCVPEGKGIRLGFNYVHGFGESAGQQIVMARDTLPFRDLADFYQRTQLPRSLVENLIQAGAMDSWNVPRRDLFWQLGLLYPQENLLPLQFTHQTVVLPSMTQAEQTGMEYAMTGISTGAHPMNFYREQLKRRHILSSLDVNRSLAGQQVVVAGLLVVHQAPPTAKGFHFLTLEDEFGFINVIVRPKVYAKFQRVIRSEGFLLVNGEVERDGAVSNLLARHISAFH
jgi:error-prone DNA polymerase